MSVGAYISRRRPAGQLRRGQRPTGPYATTCTTSRRAARARTAASSRRSSPPARRSRRRRCGSRGRACRYTLPPGYSLFNGTSMASPQAAGAAALLISAAKQAGVQKQPAQLRQAMNSSARFLDGPAHASIPIYAQGNGLIERRRGLEPAASTNIKTVGHQRVGAASTPCCRGFLATPGDRHRASTTAKACTRATATRAPTRSCAPAAARSRSTYNVSWVGNDGTFASAGTIALPHNTPVTFPVTINPTTRRRAFGDPEPRRSGDGRHRVPDDERRRRGRPVHRRQRLLRHEDRPHRPRASSSASSSTCRPARRRSRSTSAGRARPAGTGQARFLRWHPYGVGIDSNAVSNCYIGVGRCSTGSAHQPHDDEPAGGRLGSHGRRAAHLRRRTSRRSRMTASILGATVSPNPDVIASATIGVPVARTYTLTNLFGAFTGRAVGTTLGSARMRDADDREPRAAAVSGHRDGRLDLAARHDRQTRRTRQPTSTCSSSTAPPAPACWPARAPTATRRSR